MEKRYNWLMTISIVLISMCFLSSCRALLYNSMGFDKVEKDFDELDKSSRVYKLEGDMLSKDLGFDSLIFFKVIIVDYTQTEPVFTFKLVDELAAQVPKTNKKVDVFGTSIDAWERSIEGTCTPSGVWEPDGNKYIYNGYFFSQAKSGEYFKGRIYLREGVSQLLFDKNISGKFKIMPNKINYLGRILINYGSDGSGSSTKNAVFSAPYNFKIVATDDNAKEDLKWIENKYPNLHQTYSKETAMVEIK